MRSRFPTLPKPVALLAATALIVVACGGASGPDGASSAEAFSRPDEVLVGPQGNKGQFVVECTFDRFRFDDPIVFPGQPGASHLHQFFGAQGVQATSIDTELAAADTTCDQSGDTASYWAPVLIGADGQPVEPIRSVAYYRAGVGVDPTLVKPYPFGLMLVAGDHTAVAPQPLSIVAWSCGTGSLRAATPPDCTGAPSLRMTVVYQDCWDGEHLRSPIVPDPDLHVAYSSGGLCPPDTPVHIPQLQFSIDYPPPAAADLAALSLSSGSIYSGHADFWNAWDPDKLANEVAKCIGLDLVCGVSGSRSAVVTHRD